MNPRIIGEITPPISIFKKNIKVLHPQLLFIHAPYLIWGFSKVNAIVYISIMTWKTTKNTINVKHISGNNPKILYTGHTLKKVSMHSKQLLYNPR